jgi:PEP-CTERM motif
VEGESSTIQSGGIAMALKISTVTCAAVIALIAPQTAGAASLSINDAVTPDGSIIFSVGQFDRGVGFVLDGTTLMSAGLGTASATVSEGTAASGPIIHTFTGQFLTGGSLVMPTSGTIAFTEAGGGISDILTFSYTGGGAGNVATLTGSFVSDLTTSLVAPPGAILVAEGTPFTFNNTNITASAVSDVDVVPLPGALPLLASGLGALGLLGWRRKRKAAAA